jgi:hypothetical protein
MLQGSMNASGEHQSAVQQEKQVGVEDGEVTSPLKQPEGCGGKKKEVAGANVTNVNANRRLFNAGKETSTRVPTPKEEEIQDFKPNLFSDTYRI